MSQFDRFRISVLHVAIALMPLTLMSGCGVFGPGANASDVAEAFYDFQQSSGDFSELFIDATALSQAKQTINERIATYGEYETHRRIGSNRHVQLDGASRRESAIFVFEVVSEHGLTRETLKISRASAAEAFHIVDYVVEDAGSRPDPSPPGTSST